MGDITRDKEFFAGVADRRNEVTQAMNRVLSEFPDPALLTSIDTILYADDLITSRLKLTPSQRIFFHLPKGQTQLSTSELVDLLNKDEVKNAAKKNTQVDNMHKGVANRLAREINNLI
jgi:hypothetical protein